MSFVSLVSFRILINGEPSRNFSPSRELRQVDPLSPYLFIMCSEDFFQLIRWAVYQGKWQGISMGNNTPQLSYLFFADDSLSFLYDCHNSTNTLLEVIKDYETASEQRINISKSAELFSKCMMKDRRNKLE